VVACLGGGSLTLTDRPRAGSVAIVIGNLRKTHISSTSVPIQLAARVKPLPFDFAVVNPIRFQLTNPDPAWWERTTGIAVATLVIGGGPQSQIPQEILADLAGRIPNATLVTIAAGHHVHRDRPADFIAAVRDFLSP